MKLFVFVSTLFLGAAASAAAPSVSLSLSPAKTLPGLPVPLSLTVTAGDRPLALAPGVHVRATSPAGESFLARWSEGMASGELELGLIDEDELVLPPRTTTLLGIPAVSFTSESWAFDGRLVSTPGTWKLEVLLYERGKDAPLVSPPATLEIQTPGEADLWIWQALQRGEMWAIADRVPRESAYFPYASTAIRRREIVEKIDIIRGAIELHPASPVVPYLRYSIALYYGMEADRVFMAEHDFDRAVALAEKGRAELHLLARSKDPWSRLTGKKKLGDFPNREGYLAMQRLRR